MKMTSEQVYERVQHDPSETIDLTVTRTEPFLEFIVYDSEFPMTMYSSHF